MRIPILAIAILLSACTDTAERREPGPEPARTPDPLTRGEERTRIDHPGQAAAVLRSGPNVPVDLPRGFTVYPGAEVVSNTVVERDGNRRILVVFDTIDPVSEVIALYRGQARAARVTVSLDLGSDERASLGGTLAGGGEVSVGVRRNSGATRVEFASS